MAGDKKILVLGGTGPAGICLLRELVHRRHAAIVYARNPGKIPEDIASSQLLEIVKGELSDQKALSSVMARSSAVISLLGPNLRDKNIGLSVFADMYIESILPLMREHGLRRILAMGTISIKQADDNFDMMQAVMPFLMPFFANAAYQNALNIGRAFEKHGEGLAWTVFRLAQITGESDEASWKRDREDGELFNGPVGGKGWTSSLKRGALARWLVNAIEGEAQHFVGKMPGVSKLAGS